MQNILFIVGSPRKKGNTNAMVDLLNHELKSPGVKTERVFIKDYNIGGCIDCRACKKGEMECTIKDDMQELYSKINIADVLVIGTPIYWFGPTAQMKTMLDRFRPYFGNKKLNGKDAYLLLPAGSGHGDCDLTTEMFKRSFEALGVHLKGVVTAEAYDEGDVLNDQLVVSELKNVASQISC